MNFEVYGLLVLFAVVAIAFSFVCSVAEAVLLSITPSYIHSMKNTAPATAKLLKDLKADVDRPLSAILSLNTIAHTVGATGVGAQAAAIWGSGAVGITSAVMTLLILVLSEIIPKTIGAVYWKPLSPSIARFLTGLTAFLAPLVWLSKMITRSISRKEKSVVTREEVEALADLSIASGQFPASESKLLRNLFRLPVLCVGDIMTPRTVIISFSADETVAEALTHQPKLPVSRLPLTEGTIDNITGFVLYADMLQAMAEGKGDMKLSEFRRDIVAVPVKASLTKLLDSFLNNRQHIALVVDEYGGTTGLVTMEDLVETILGAEIVDEADHHVDMRKLAREKWKKRMQSHGIATGKTSAEE